MHSYIIQIYNEPIDKDNYLDENTLELDIQACVDYCYNLDFNDRERQEFIAALVRQLPDGLFSLGEENGTIVYNGGAEEWVCEKWIPEIRNRVGALNAQNIFYSLELYRTKEVIDNALDIGTLFYLTAGTYQSYAEKSTAFVEFVSGLEKGAVLHVGGVIGYHY